MIKFIMNSELYEIVKTPLWLLVFTIVLIILITCVFVRKEIKK